MVFEPLRDNAVGPEAVGAFAKEAEVAAVVGGEELDSRVGTDGGGFVDAEWDESVVPGLNEERGDADLRKVAEGGLVPVVELSGAEAAIWGGDAVVMGNERAEAGEILLGVAAG